MTDVLLVNGSIATLRPIQSSDHDAVVALHDDVGDDSIRFRFFTISRAPGRAYAERLCDPTCDVIALVAYVADALVAVASAEPAEPGVAEVSFLVADTAHGLGLGTLLLEHLAAAARDRGIRRFTAEVLADNWPMLHVFSDCGFDSERTSDQGVVTLYLDTAATARAVAAADVREAKAEARSLAALLYPTSVAVVGVRRDGGGVGRAVLHELAAGGFAGPVYVVHPDLHPADGLTVRPDFASIGRPVDLVVVAVPAHAVVDVVRQAAEAGARAAVVLSSGFSEVGPEGAELQRELVAVARHHSMRIAGPNCLGIMSSGIRLNATFAAGLPAPGGLAVASQSGGVGIALLDLARESGAGMASFVSLGNKADVSGNDLLAAWLDDDRVAAAAFYLESFGNARKFARLARRFAERKPLLAVVGGRSSGGRRAGASHTAAAAAPSVGVDALFAQSGVIGCRSLAELADAARLLTSQPLPAGPRLGVVGNAGGLGVLAADAASTDRLVVPELSPTLQEALAGLAPGAAGVSNPLDLGAAADAAALLAATTALLESDEIDAVLLIVAGTRVTDADGFLRDLVRHRARAAAKPLLLVVIGEVGVPEATQTGAQTGAQTAFARFRSVEDATAALSHAATYGAWLTTPVGTPRPEVPGAAERARRTIDDASGWLPSGQARDLLGCYDLTGPPSEVVHGGAEAILAATRLGFPVVVKAADPAVVHKTDRGLVRIGMRTPDDVRRAVHSMAEELNDAHPAILVQAQLEDGVEVALGVVRDPGFGPLVMVAAGGVATDVWDDRVFLMPPVTELDAARAVRSLRIWPLLAGFRGSPAVDVAALEGVVQAVGQLALDCPDVAELDLNPVIMTPHGAACVDAKVRVAPDTAADAGLLRSLRSRN